MKTNEKQPTERKSAHTLIFVTGAPYSAKTTWATGLAKSLTELSSKPRVVVLYPDGIHEPLATLFPTKVGDKPSDEQKAKMQTGSLANILRIPDFTQRDILGQINIQVGDRNLGYLGFLPWDKTDSYPYYSEGKAKKIIDILLTNADFLIVDGSSNPTSDPFSTVAMKMADIVLYCLSPNLSGISYHAVVGEPKAEGKTVMRLFAETRPDDFPLLKELERLAGPPNEVLPYNDLFYRRLCMGNGIAAFSEKSIRNATDSLAGQIWEVLHAHE